MTRAARAKRTKEGHNGVTLRGWRKPVDTTLRAHPAWYYQTSRPVIVPPVAFPYRSTNTLAHRENRADEL